MIIVSPIPATRQSRIVTKQWTYTKTQNVLDDTFIIHACYITCSRNVLQTIKIIAISLQTCTWTKAHRFHIHIRMYIHVHVALNICTHVIIHVHLHIINPHNHTIFKNSSSAISPWATSMTSLTIASFLCRSTAQTCPSVRSCSCHATRRFLISCFQ